MRLVVHPSLYKKAKELFPDMQIECSDILFEDDWIYIS